MIKRYANFNSSNNFIGFLSNDVHDTIPNTAILITDSLWQEMQQKGPENYISSNGSVKYNQPSSFSVLQTEKKNKKAEIKSSFKESLATGACTLSLGWEIDCRRGDVENMRGLLEIAKKKGLTDNDPIGPKGIMGYDNQWHSATVAEVRDIIIPEMCEYGASLYQKKFQLIEQVSNAKTPEEVAAITWK